MIIFDKIEEVSRNYYNVSISVVHNLEDKPIKKEYKDIKATTEEELKREIERDVLGIWWFKICKNDK